MENIDLPESMKILKFVESSGNGYDLPKGCVLEILNFEVPYLMYWNPNGIAISNDFSIRTVCYDPRKAVDGTNSFLKIVDVSN